jgi:hypothetical protein
MSLKFPDYNGLKSTTDDNRIYVQNDVKNGAHLTAKHSFMLMHIGNPLYNKIVRGDPNGGLNNLRVIFTNGSVSTNGRTLISFDVDDNLIRLSSKSRYNGCSGGTQVSVSASSPEVTFDNCEWLLVEKYDPEVDDNREWTVSLIDKSGTIHRGTTVTSFLCGFQVQNSNDKKFYLGGLYNSSETSGLGSNWRNSVGHFLTVSSTTEMTSLEADIQSFILGGNSPDSIWGSNVSLYATLSDLSTGLTNQGTLTDYSFYINDVNNRLEIGSNPVPVDTTGSVVLHENKHNIVGCHCTFDGVENGTVNLSGRYTGTVTGVEVRLLKSKDMSVAYDWQEVDSSPAGGSWSGTISVEPDIYYIEARPKNNTSAVYNGRNEWFVAPIFGILGQSQMAILCGAGNNYNSTAPTNQTRVLYAGDYGLIRALENHEAGNVEYIALEAWQRLMGDMPIIFADMNDAGEGMGNFLNNGNGDQDIPIMGDGSYGSGSMSNLKYLLGTDKVNIVINWGTSDATADAEDYKDKVRGLLFNEGPYSGAAYSHLSDFYDIGGVVINGHVRHDYRGSAYDDYAYVNSNDGVRRRQIELWREIIPLEQSGKYVIGTQNNDIWMGDLAVGETSPHQAGEFGSPRIAESMGISCAWLASKKYYNNPRMRTAYLSNSDLEIRLPFFKGSGGNIKVLDGSNQVERISVSAPAIQNYSPPSYTSVFDYTSQEVVITKDSGEAWTDDLANYDLFIGYNPPVWGDRTQEEAEASLDRILVEECAYMPRGLQVECDNVNVVGSSAHAYSYDQGSFEYNPEDRTYSNVLARLPLVSDTNDLLGNTTSVTGSVVSNFEHGLQTVLENPIIWDGNDLTELNVDANADGFTVTDEDGLVVKNT